ncbi:mannitol dehydrogenase family protein [Pseudonocardia xinjiangensis]|uniref:Mannitol-1-phosphate 5-dehydrogenase n=1 Tax=Pseudonocardia xinjiangensis TaxID=75289 RepID=A0ABX1RJ42_9PSEU|nr:mannitol dehydrogenase family protein [Pseudonocardia xinjiangensis]NMH80387.1 mannitol dehydrogenase family protein [Pseudonocardia xinjiangensis]
MDVPRLSTSTLDDITPGVPVGVRRPDTAIGIVHLGIGAFHRAHQAVFTEEAMAAEGVGSWGICGVTQRSRGVVDQLAPQDGLYGVLERSDREVSVRVVGSVLEVVSAAEQPELVRSRIADAAVGVVTLTVTEKGYRREPGGRLDLRDTAVQADLAGTAAPETAIGRLARGLQRRREENGAPLTVLSCDNLVGNGEVVRTLVADFCAALPAAEGEPLWEWVTSNVSFPSSMVDRIVPATTDDDREQAQHLMGLRDAGLVVAEPFRQWVIEDHFAGPVPAWHRVGATLTADVAPYEAVKLRLLNATHSLLAYTGALAGYETIAEAVRDETLAAAAASLMAEDALPTLRRPDDLDLDDYQRSVLDRFANPALRHRTTQVAMDGSMKLPVRLLGTVRDRLRAGAEPRWAAMAVAAWMVYVARGRDAAGRALPLDDPLADRLRAAAAGSDGGLVERMLAVDEVFDPELRDSEVLRSLLAERVEELLVTR